MNETKKVIIAAAIMVPLSITIMFWAIAPVEPTSLQRHSIEIQ
jgi:hypothetical protein